MAVKTLHRALISPNETSSGFFTNHDVTSLHEEVSSEPKAWNVSDISPLSYPVFRDGGTVGAGGLPPQIFAGPFTLSQAGGADYAPYITTCPNQIFGHPTILEF